MENLRLPRGLLNRTVTLGTFHQVVSLAILLLDSFGPKAMLQGQGPVKGRDFVLRQNLPWVLNGYNRLRRVVVKWLQRTEPELAQSEERIVLEFLSSTHRMCVPQFSAPVLLSDMSLTATWIQCLGELIYPSITCQSSTLQVVLADYLDEVVQTSRQLKLSDQSLKETFFPVLQEVNDQGLNLESIDSRLWVNFNISSAESNPEKANSMKQSLQSLNDGRLHITLSATRPSGPLTVLSGSKLPIASQRQDMTGENQESNEEKRAPKRLCLAAAHTDQDSLQIFMNNLSSLLGITCAGSLTDLRSALE